jgi:hypothetical protein
MTIEVSHRKEKRMSDFALEIVFDGPGNVRSVKLNGKPSKGTQQWDPKLVKRRLAVLVPGVEVVELNPTCVRIGGWLYCF